MRKTGDRKARSPNDVRSCEIKQDYALELQKCYRSWRLVTFIAAAFANSKCENWAVTRNLEYVTRVVTRFMSGLVAHMGRLRTIIFDAQIGSWTTRTGG